MDQGSAEWAGGLYLMWDGVRPLRVGIVTHLPLPQGTIKRPVEVGAGVATSSQEGCPG